MKKILIILFLIPTVGYTQLEYIGMSYEEFSEKYSKEFPFSAGYEYEDYFLYESLQDSINAYFYMYDTIFGIDYKLIYQSSKADNFIKRIDKRSKLIGHGLLYTADGILINYLLKHDTLIIQIRDMFHYYKIDSELKDTL